jgi:dTDP-3-amino-3,4,6-trideoxy-alpha-D-glucose transaminase
MVASLATGKPVSFGNLTQQHADLRTELSEAFDRVLATSSFVLGEEVEGFEREFAAYCGVEHCVGVGSGTAALTLSLVGAGIGEGDEVIVPAHTFIATALAVLHAGATPVLCDVRDADGLIDVDHARHLISERTAALLPVHLYGQLCDPGPLRQLAARQGLLLLEDAAQAHGARGDDASAGTLGSIAAFSFYPGKNLGALGDAGAICTDDAEIAASARRLRDLGRSSHGLHRVAGFNERMDGIQAAFLREKLPRLDAGNERRRELAATYRRLLPESARCLPDRGGASVFHLFPIRVEDRDGLRAELADAGVQTGIHYSPAVHEQPALRHLHGDETLPVASSWAREELSLPLYPGLEAAGLERVAEEVSRRLA